MPIESANYITQLVATNPPSGDLVGNAADHLRLIKSVLSRTFPNVNAPVTATPKNLNSDTIPVGGCIIWTGATAAIPSTWGLCDGSTYQKVDGSGPITSPDLRDRFIVGAGGSYAVGATGGAASNQPTIGGTALTQAQLPSCGFPVSDPGHNHGLHDPGHAHGTQNYSINAGGASFNAGYGGAGSTSSGTYAAATGIWLDGSGTGISVSSGGSNATHTHSITSVPTLPPYYTLAFIMKL